jgi:creatinine amidohydrolase
MSMRLWQDLPWTEFSTLPAGTVAVIPTAAIEQHGPHLPVATDAVINEGILARIATLLPADVPVLLLPMQSVGLSVEHIRFPGTLTGSAETLLAFWTELGTSVARAGVRRLLFLNSHGGQPQILDLVCRRLRAEAKLFAVACSWGRLGLPDGLIDPMERRHGIHGGEIETSLMLRLRPDLVRMEHAQDFRSAWQDHEQTNRRLEAEGAVGFGWETQDLNPAGALGNAARATVEKGEAILANAAARLAELLGEISAFDVANWLREGPG